MIRDRQAPSRPEIFYPVATHQTAEHLMGANFVNGQPIFRRTGVIPGGLNSSTETIAALAGVMQFLVTASWTGFDDSNDEFLFMRASTVNGLSFNVVTGLLTIFHQGFDFSNEFMVFTLEYTKLPGN